MTPGYLPLVEDYLTLRRAHGFAVERPGWLLRDFARFADGLAHPGPITVDLAVRWALSQRAGGPANAARRLGVVRQFARHRVALDPATEIPPSDVLGRPTGRPQPHIYSEEEIAALLQACRRLPPRDGLRPVTYVAFFALLASTGLRLSEACRLGRRDVDLTTGLLTVHAGKFRKARLVPLHPTGVQALARYAARRDACRTAPPSECFFRTDHTPALTRPAVEQTFRQLRHRLGWSAPGRTRRPRIHDLRHTFAVRRLLRWAHDGLALEGQMLALATYLGHAKVTDTFWYLSAVPELMAITAQRFERFARREQERTL